MKFFKNLQINALLTAIVYIILGLVLVLMPNLVTHTVAIILGAIFAVAGIYYIVDYFRKWDIEYRSNGLAIGILMLFASLFFFFQSEVIAALIPLILGFAVVVSSTIKLQNAIVLYKAKDKGWISLLVLAGVSLILGVIIMLDPFAALHGLLILIGVSLLFSGITDLVIIFVMSRKVKALGLGGKGGAKRAVVEAATPDKPIDPVEEAINGYDTMTKK